MTSQTATKPAPPGAQEGEAPVSTPPAPLEQAKTFPQDLLASVVVFLVALPLCLGIAIASGAPPAAGLITGIIGGIVAGSLSGCPLQVSGPAAGLAVIVVDLIQRFGFEMLGPIVVMTGILQLVAGMLRVGGLFRAIAPAVVYGMLAGIGILIFGAQFHVMVDDSPRANGLQNLLSIPEAIYKGILPVDGSTHHVAAGIGLMTIIVILSWGKLAPPRIKWIPGTLVAVVLATAITQLLSLPIKFVNLPDNLLSSIALPNWQNYMRMTELPLIIAGLTVAFVASAETLLSAGAVDQMHNGPRANYNKELFAQGVGNTLAGLAGALPMTGVIVRSATNVAAGAKTRRSAIMHGLWLLVLVSAAPSVLRLIPTASLAAVLVYTGYKLVNPENIRRLLRFGGAPIIIYAATVIMIVCTDLLLGIATGLALSVIKILWALTRMHIDVQPDPRENRIDVHVSGAATFLSMPKLLDTLNALPETTPIDVHLRGLQYIDHACFDALAGWEKQRCDRGLPVTVEWQEARERYYRTNRFGYLAKSRYPEPHVGGSAH